jgi:hypothetical protein
MGMTYRIISPCSGVTAKDVKDVLSATDWANPAWEKIEDESLELVDDLVFDRECLASWMDVTAEDYIDFNYCFVITRDHVKNAISTLRNLVEKVKTMPFDELTPEDDEPGIFKKYDDKKCDFVESYVGSPNNVAILKEVEKVMAREYHFTFPWEHDRNYDRIGDMILALEKVGRFMEENPDRIVLGLYY